MLKKIASFFAVLIFIVIGKFVFQVIFKTGPMHKRAREASKIVEGLKVEYEKDMNALGDKNNNVYVEKVEADVWTLRIWSVVKTVDPSNDFSENERRMVNFLCNKKTTYGFFLKGVEYEYIYSDPKGKILTKMKIGLQECQKLNNP